MERTGQKRRRYSIRFYSWRCASVSKGIGGGRARKAMRPRRTAASQGGGGEAQGHLPTCGCACKCHRLQMKTCRACAGETLESLSQRRCCDSAERSQPRRHWAAASPHAFGGPVPCARSGRAQQPGERLGPAVRSAEGLGSQAVGLGYLRTAELRADVLLEGSVRVVATAVAPKAAAEHVGLRHGLQRAAGSGGGAAASRGSMV